jgi:hypothetical protein
MEPVPRRNHERAKASPKCASQRPGILMSPENEAPDGRAAVTRDMGVHDMTTLKSHPYWGIQSEEVQEAMRRAHAERAKVVHQILTALVSWRRRKSPERRAATGLNPAHTFLPPAI